MSKDLKWFMVVQTAIVAVFLAILAFLTLKVVNDPIAVCHAVTEDSDISDCDYHDGAWWTK